MKLSSLLLICAICSLPACQDDQPPVPIPASHDMTPVRYDSKNRPLAPPPDRFHVRLQYTFWDELAYGNKRGVYLITDTKTGKEILGISGIGTVDLGYYTRTGQEGKVTSTKRVGTEQ